MRLAKNTAATDKVGKAIQLWTAGGCKLLRESGAGAASADTAVSI